MEKKPRRRIVSTLGLGSNRHKTRYEPVYYEFAGVRSRKTPLLQEALAEIFDPTTKMQIFGTKPVKKTWIRDCGITLEGQRTYLTRDRFRFKSIPDGKTKEGLETLFWHVVDSLHAEPLSALNETEAPEEIILDVTHGFRSQPMIALAAASYVQSEWIRKKVKNPPVVKVLYGAFDAKTEEGIAPIWDLTPFLRFARWNEAFSAFERFGRADDIQLLASTLRQEKIHELREAEANPDFRKHPEISWLKNLGTQAAKFTDELVTNRIEDWPKSARRLKKTVASDHAENEDYRFIGTIVKNLAEYIDAFDVDSPYSAEGLTAIAASTQRLVDYQQYSQAVLLIDEALKIYCGLLLCEPDAQHKAIYDAGRNYITTALAQKERSDVDSDALMQASALAKRVDTPRKTLAHAGVTFQGNSPAKSDIIIRNAKELAKAFGALVEKMPPAGSCVPDANEERASVFLNCSNHPVASWTEKQQAAARRQFGEPVDFEGWNPQIDPQAGTPEIVHIADSYAKQAVALGVKHAFVAGEPLFTTALVACLQDEGISCYCATTKRHKKEVPQPDDTVKTISSFDFVQWREYPDLKRVLREG